MHSQPLDRDSILANIITSYHPTITKILDNMIQKDESVYAATTCSRTEYEDENGKSKARSKFCVVVVTTYRWIRAGWAMYDGIANGTVYYRSGSRFDAFVGLPFYEHKWVRPPRNPPDKKRLGRNTLAEYVNEYILEFPLKDLANVKGRENYTVVDDGVQLELIEIHLEGGAWYAFEHNQGETIYSLLQLAEKNGGRIPADTGEVALEFQNHSQPPDMLTKLERLARLYETGHLTEEEFRIAKKKLL